MFDVSDPTLVRDSDIANAGGANARRLGVAATLNSAVSQIMSDVAQITDEWMWDYPAGQSFDYLDKRDSEGFEANFSTSDEHLGALDRVYYMSSLAIPAVRAYTPDSLRGDFLAQLYAIRGYAVLQIAEDMCPGFPLNDVGADSRPLFSGPLTTDSAVALASALFDSAIVYAHDSTRFLTLARVAKGRALLYQGKYAEAESVVASVATSDVYQTDGDDYNILYDVMRPRRWRVGSAHEAVGERKGGNGMPFASAQDPRISLIVGGPSATDTTDTLYRTTKYPDPNTPIILAGGIEARLIEAEAALHEPNPTKAFAILDTLRATIGLDPLTVPTTTDAQVDTLYKERAFWLYLTGRRLGDLRRLIKNYGRGPESVFPTGAYPSGGTYGSATAIPFILAVQQRSNPNMTTGCSVR